MHTVVLYAYVYIIYYSYSITYYYEYLVFENDNSECRVSSKKRQMPAFLLLTRVGVRIRRFCGASKEVSQPTTTPSPSNAFLRLCAE